MRSGNLHSLLRLHQLGTNITSTYVYNVFAPGKRKLLAHPSDVQTQDSWCQTPLSSSLSHISKHPIPFGTMFVYTICIYISNSRRERSLFPYYESWRGKMKLLRNYKRLLLVLRWVGKWVGMDMEYGIGTTANLSISTCYIFPSFIKFYVC